MHHPSLNIHSSFENRIEEVICLRHVWGVIFMVLGNYKIFRTKHLKAFGTFFPSFSFFNDTFKLLEGKEKTMKDQEIAGSSEDQSVSDSNPNESTEDMLDYLTHVTTVTSTFGESATEACEEVDGGCSETGQEESVPEGSRSWVGNVRYNHLEKPRINYSCV